MKSATINLRALRPLCLGEIFSPVPDTFSRLNGRNDIEHSLYLELHSFRTTARYFKYTLDYVHQMFLLIRLKAFEKLSEYFSTMCEPYLKYRMGLGGKSNTNYPFVMYLSITCHMPVFFKAFAS